MTALTLEGICEAFRKVECPNVATFFERLTSQPEGTSIKPFHIKIKRRSSPDAAELWINNVRDPNTLTIKMKGREPTHIRTLEYLEMFLASALRDELQVVERSAANADVKSFCA